MPTCHHGEQLPTKKTQAFQEGLGPQGGSGWPRMSLLSRCALLHWKCWRLYHWWMVWNFNLLEDLTTYCISCCQPAKLFFLYIYIYIYMHIYDIDSEDFIIHNTLRQTFTQLQSMCPASTSRFFTADLDTGQETVTGLERDHGYLNPWCQRGSWH